MVKHVEICLLDPNIYYGKILSSVESTIDVAPEELGRRNLLRIFLMYKVCLDMDVMDQILH